MKKTLINACMAIALVAIAGSCSNEELIEMEQTPLGELELSATIGTSTRTIIGEDGKMTWVTGDAFYAWGNNSNSTATFTLYEGVGKASGLFSGKLESGYAEYLEEVVYPKSMVKRDGKKVIVDMKSVSFDNSSAPMYGKIASGNVEFNNLVSMLRVTINNLPENATLSVSGKGIAGEATLVDGELTDFSTSAQTIQVTGIPAGTQTIDIPVYPTAKKVSISFAINNGKKYTLSIQPEKGKVLKSSIPELSYVNGDLAIVWDGNVDTSWYKSSKYSFTLKTPAQLAGLAKIVAGDSNSGNNLKGKNIKLGYSFDMAGLDFEAIGSYGSSKSFSGTFDGNKKTISGLNVVNTGDGTYAGLFGSVGGATVKNLTITNSYFEAQYCGCVAGYLYGDISLDNVLVTNSIAKEDGTEYENKLIGNGGNGKANDADDNVVVVNADDLIAALEANENVIFSNPVNIDPANMSNAYGTTGINVKNGQTIDGNGFTLDIKGAGETWDSGINTTGGLIKDLTVTGSFRGIFINHNSTHSEKVILENVIIDGTTYTISCDQGLNQGLEATNSTFKGWTSYAGTLGNAKFTDCYFGAGNGYSFCRPYAPTEFIGCEFEEGYRMDPRAAVTFENCTLNGVALTAENLATLVTNITNATVK